MRGSIGRIMSEKIIGRGRGRGRGSEGGREGEREEERESVCVHCQCVCNNNVISHTLRAVIGDTRGGS